MKRIIMFVVIIFLNSLLFSQQSKLFIPLDVQKAYENGTRSYDGNVTEEYWINRTDYKISAELIPDSNLIVGSEIITYYNESPDTLREIVIPTLTPSPP